MIEDNSQLMERCFRKAVINGDLGDASILKYRDSVKNFFLVVGDIFFGDLRIEDFENYIISAKQRGASNSRIANVISALKWILFRLQSENIISKELDIDKVKKPKVERKEVAYLTEIEVKHFLTAIENDNSKGLKIRKVRFMALSQLLLQTGARIGEALSIKKEDIDRCNREIRIIGKGKKPRTLLLRMDTIKIIDQYLLMREDESDWLFVTQDGRSKWSKTDVGRGFKRYKGLSGIKKKFTIHTFRHTFATQLLLSNVPINTVQFLLGHANLETTMKYYIGAVNKDQARQYMNDEYFEFIPSND